jgi:hypothetical protein
VSLAGCLAKLHSGYWQELLSWQGWTGQICLQVHGHDCWQASNPLWLFGQRHPLLATQAWSERSITAASPQSEQERERVREDTKREAMIFL